MEGNRAQVESRRAVFLSLGNLIWLIRGRGKKAALAPKKLTWPTVNLNPLESTLAEVYQNKGL
jgi:hypothetical protein